MLVLPPDVASLDEANAAIKLWEYYKRRTLDPSQRLTVQVMMATNSAGLWAATTTGREMSRQNGKGDEVEVVELWGLVQRSERILHTVHDAVLLATETQSRLLSVLEGHADLRRLVGRVWRGTGQQMIEMTNGGTIWYRTRTGGGGRGVDEVDRIVVDEAQHAEEEHLAAITPTQMASANPQLNALGSAGIDGKSRWWWRLRRRALAPAPGMFGYVGHTAERVRLDDRGRVIQEPVDVKSLASLRAANPALVSGRVGRPFFDEQLSRLGPALYAREHLGVWDPEPIEDNVEHPVSLEEWTACMDSTSRVSGSVCLGISVSKGGSSASITAVGNRSDGLPMVEVQDSRSGTLWVTDRLTAMLASPHQPVAAVAVPPRSGPISTVYDEVERLCKHYKVPLVALTGGEYAGACSRFVELVRSEQLRHVGQVWLSTAIGGCERHETGEVWVWELDPKLPADPSPLISSTVAMRALETRPVVTELATVHSF